MSSRHHKCLFPFHFIWPMAPFTVNLQAQLICWVRLKYFNIFYTKGNFVICVLILNFQKGIYLNPPDSEFMHHLSLLQLSIPPSSRNCRVFPVLYRTFNIVQSIKISYSHFSTRHIMPPAADWLCFVAVCLFAHRRLLTTVAASASAPLINVDDHHTSVLLVID